MRDDLTRIGNLSKERRTEVVEEYDDHDNAITIGELLDRLDGAGLVITDTALLTKALSNVSMTPDTNITWAGTDA